MTPHRIDPSGCAPTAATGNVFVVSCGGAKLDQAAPAGELYTGSTFRLQLAAALAEAEEGDTDGTVAPAADSLATARRSQGPLSRLTPGAKRLD